MTGRHEAKISLPWKGACGYREGDMIFPGGGETDCGYRGVDMLAIGGCITE